MFSSTLHSKSKSITVGTEHLLYKININSKILTEFIAFSYLSALTSEFCLFMIHSTALFMCIADTIFN